MLLGGKAAVVLLTSRDVRPGEELTWDYGMTADNPKEVEAADCMCGTAECTGKYITLAQVRLFADNSC